MSMELYEKLRIRVFENVSNTDILSQYAEIDLNSNGAISETGKQNK